LTDFISYLYADSKSSSSNMKTIVPIKWLEAKLTMIRKLALEARFSLSLEQDNVMVSVFNNSELIFKRQNLSS